jgi:uncharacterized protein (TIGR02001 family)
MKKLLLTLAAIFTLGTAQAEWNRSISLNSDNRIRGISENQAQPGVVFDINQQFKNGFYVGTKVPSVSGGLGYGFHVDPYAGYKFSPVNGLTVDIGTMNYLFPKVTKYVTNEVYTNVSYSIFTVKANRSLSNYFSYPGSEGTTYYEAGVVIPLNNKLTARAHVGKVDIANNELFNYTTRQASLSYQYSKDWTVTGTYITNKNLTDIAKNFGFVENGHALWKDTVVISIKKSF